MHVFVPGGRAAQGINEGLEVPTTAPFEPGDAAQRIRSFGHLAQAVVFHDTLSSGPVLNHCGIKAVESELFKSGVGVSDSCDSIQGVIIKGDCVSAYIRLGPGPAKGIVSGRGHIIGPRQRAILGDEIAIGVVGIGSDLSLRTGRCQQLSPSIIRVGGRLAGSIGSRQRQMLAVVSHFGQQVAAVGAGLADLQQVNAVGGVEPGGRTPKRVARAGLVAKAVIGVGEQLGGAVIEHPAHMAGKVVGSNHVGGILPRVIVPDAAFQCFFRAFKSA